MKYAIIDPNGIVINLVTYDGSSEFTPVGGTKLVQVNDWIVIGENQDTPEPVIVLPVDPPPPPPTLEQKFTNLVNVLVANKIITSDEITGS